MSVFLLPWALAAVNPQQESSLGVVLAETTLPPSSAGIPAMNMVTIQQVLPNSPAALAGLLPGDGIVRVDNSPVLNASDVTQWVKKRTAKEGVTLTIMRRGWLGQYVPMLVPVLLPPGAAGSAPVPSAAQPASRAPGSISTPKPGRPTAAWLGVKFNLKAQPVKVHSTENRTCYAIAPPDWFVWGQTKEGNAVDLGAPDFSWASWGSLGVIGSAARDVPSLATPEANIQWVLSSGGAGQRVHVTYGEPIRDEFGYIWLPYVKEDLKARGIVIYRVFSVPNDPRGYILISRTAQMPTQLWEQKGALALRVALSIRCNVQLRASPDSPRPPPSDDDKVESTYNRELGTEYAHNPATGEIYWMNHAGDWKETGPQGPGYYIRSGNEWKKLEPGLGR